MYSAARHRLPHNRLDRRLNILDLETRDLDILLAELHVQSVIDCRRDRLGTGCRDIIERHDIVVSRHDATEKAKAESRSEAILFCLVDLLLLDNIVEPDAEDCTVACWRFNDFREDYGLLDCVKSPGLHLLGRARIGRSIPLELKKIPLE